MKTQIVYVKLMDEGIDVWRPVESSLVAEPNIFRLANTDSSTEGGTWEFRPGSLVEVEMKTINDEELPVAVRLSR